MNLDDDLRAALDLGDEPAAGAGFDDVRARAGRLRRRRRARRVGVSAGAIVVVIGGFVAGTARDPQDVVVGDETTTSPQPTVPDPTTTTTGSEPRPETPSDTVPTTTRPDTVPTTTRPDTTPSTTRPDTVPTTRPDTTPTTTTEVDADEAAATAFIDAWSRGDADAMRQLADSHAVDVALAFGTAQGNGSCTSQPNGQYQCVVDASSGTRTYILVGEPGAPEGHVWWVSEYNPDT